MDITDFLLEKGYKIEYKTLNPKGRGKFQYFCGIDKKPTDEEIAEIEKEYKVKVLKCNFKKGKELTILMKKCQEEERKEVESKIIDISLNGITEMVYDKDLSRDQLRDLLSMFQTSAYTKGYNAHKGAMEKLLGTQINFKSEDEDKIIE